MDCRKRELIRFMHAAGFDWISDISVDSANREVVCSHGRDGTEWWRPLEVEGSGFEQLFKGAIRYTMRK